jgi:hypothetical protein
MITDDQKWESLASEYLRRLASKDMQQWARYWKSEDRSTGPDAEPHVNASETISKRERDRGRLMRVTSQTRIRHLKNEPSACTPNDKPRPQGLIDGQA